LIADKVEKVPSLFAIGENGVVIEKFVEKLDAKVIGKLKQLTSSENVAKEAELEVLPPPPPVVKPEEPKKVEANDVDHNVTRILFKSLDGSSFKESFKIDDTLDRLMAHVSEKLQISRNQKIALSTVYPKHEFESSEYEKTLQELGLCPSAVIYVKIRTDDSSTITLAPLHWPLFLINSLIGIILASFTKIKAFFSGSNNTDRKQEQRDNVLKRYVLIVIEQ
jgi:hypothetical protein